jgi:hypothetical protein
VSYVPSNVAAYRLELLRELVAGRAGWAFDAAALRFYYLPKGLHGEKLGWYLDVAVAVMFEDAAMVVDAIERGAAEAMLARIDASLN